jgi:hypothetical protein
MSPQANPRTRRTDMYTIASGPNPSRGHLFNETDFDTIFQERQSKGHAGRASANLIIAYQNHLI